jgi:2-dehydropantoate 2-reductase
VRTAADEITRRVEQVALVGPRCPTSTVIPTVVWCPAETQPQGWVRLRGRPELALPPVGGHVAALLADVGWKTDVVDDFVTAAWHKLLTNAVSGLMALTLRRCGMFERDDIVSLSRSYLAECLTVARAEGATLSQHVITEILARLASAPTDMATSMLGDRVAGRPLEWDARTGVILRKARSHGLPAPISEVIVPLLAAASDGPG